jgi:hypothetical protein
VSDSEDVPIAGILEHIEEAGVRTGGEHGLEVVEGKEAEERSWRVTRGLTPR